MFTFFDSVEQVFELFVHYAILLTDLIGIVVLLYAVFKALADLIRKKDKVRLHLAEGIALAMEFKMGGELLRTVIAREWQELAVLGTVIAIRAAMSFLIHWEIKHEKE